MRVEVEFYHSEDSGVRCECHGNEPKVGVLCLLKPDGGAYARFEVCYETLDVLETMELHEENAAKAK